MNSIGSKSVVVLTTLVLAVGALAGCGGSDDANSTTIAAAISKEEFVTQGNQICADGNEQFDDALDQLQADVGKRPSEADMEQFATESAVPIIQDQIDQLRALGVPAGEGDQVNEFLDSAQSNVDELENDPTLFTSNLFAETNKLAGQYGLTECGGS